jgi:hypothetical protein
MQAAVALRLSGGVATYLASLSYNKELVSSFIVLSLQGEFISNPPQCDPAEPAAMVAILQDLKQL